MIVDHNQTYLEESKPEEVVIWDETLRDGEQAPGVAFSIEQKIALARQMDEAGMGIIDIGFPVVSEEEKETVRIMKRLRLKAQLGVTLRANKKDIDCALECGVHLGFVFSPTSHLHINAKFGVSPEEHRRSVLEAVKYALDSGMDICFISEDTSRSQLEYVIPLFNEAIDMGVDKIMITDTVGVMVPGTIKPFVSQIISACASHVRFGIHCHNDFGLATANTLAAVEAGVVMPTVTINGIGERAGNAAFEEVTMALELIYKIKTGINLKKIVPLSKMVERFSGLPVSPNKAVVGYNAFRHESGIHVHSMLKAVKTYETFPPKLLGRKHEFVLGKHSGRSLIKHILSTQHQDNEALEELLLNIVKNNCINNENKEKMYHDLQEYYKKELGMTEEELMTIYRKMGSPRN